MELPARAFPKIGAGLRSALAVLSASAALASAFCLSLGLRHLEARASHQQRTPEAWLETATPSSPALISKGRALFLSNCAHCHGADATGDEGPDLHGVAVSDRYIANIITFGIKHEMPSFRRKLGRDEIAGLTAYLRSLDGAPSLGGADTASASGADVPGAAASGAQGD